MARKQNGQIKVGDIVNAIVWSPLEDENPRCENFFTGIVKEIIRKERGIVYVQIESLPKTLPIERLKP